ncbi:hypothetical protein ABEY41_21480 [Peribacillus butanolivorans]|uniref:hypothetical protein n=1 Tax=Peribacillus butanolivorans TaxID=421767 RepID=UPI003D2D2F2B
MDHSIQENKNAAKPMMLTIALVLAGILLFTIRGIFQNVDLWIPNTLFLLIDIGFIVAMIMGIRTRRSSIILFSVISNGIFFILLSFFIFLLALANGISEP